jgi:uncharacterized membrane protein
MNKKIFLIISFISLIILLTLTNLLVFDKLEVKGCGCPKVISHNQVIFFIILSVIFISSLFYYLFNLTINKKENVIQSNINTIYSILEKDEKKVFDMIISNKGKIEQTEISKKYGKIKAHRLVQKLKTKNIINVIKKGSKNNITLKKNLEQVIKK